MLAAEKPPLGGIYLAHYGVKGMVWGTRKMAKLGGYASTSDITTQERKSFKREVELAYRGKGLARDASKSPLTRKPVSPEFARAVLRKAANTKKKVQYAKTGAAVTTVLLAGVAIGTTVRGTN